MAERTFRVAATLPLRVDQSASDSDLAEALSTLLPAAREAIGVLINEPTSNRAQQVGWAGLFALDVAVGVAAELWDRLDRVPGSDHG